MKKSPKKTILPKGPYALAAILALCLASMPHAAMAQAPPSQEIEVIARLDDPSSRATGAVHSLTRSDLEAQAPMTLLESLSLLPGVDAFEKGGAGSGSYLALRGGEPNFTLVVINGVRVNDPMLTSGRGFDFTLIGAEDAAQVDILSGPWSTAYGADALAGVVSIRLDAPDDEPGAAARMGLGSGGRYEIGGRAALSGKAGSLILAAGARDTGSVLAGSSNRGQSAMFSASTNLGSAVSLDLFGFYGASEGSGFPEDSGGPDLALVRELETRDREQVALGATLRADLAQALAGQLRLGWSRSAFESISPGIASGLRDGVPPISSDSQFDRFEAVASLDWIPQGPLSGSLGASLVHEEGQSDSEIDFGFPIPTAYELSRALPGLFATVSAQLPRDIELHAGIRGDFPESGKTRITPRAGLRVPLGTGGMRVTANFAQGFKQPSFFALGFPLLANPDLLPERSETWDAGLEWTSRDNNWQASAMAYRSVYRDLIDFDPDLFTNVNRNRVSAQGAEFAVAGKAADLRLRASLTYLDTKSADGAQLRFRPQWKGAASVDWAATSRLSLRLDGRFSSGFLDSSVPTGFARLSSYATIDAQARFKLNDSLDLRASLRNVTAERFSRTIGTPEPGRTVFVSLHATL